MASRGTKASVQTGPNLLSVIISLAKQTSNYAKITVASEKKLEYSVWACKSTDTLNLPNMLFLHG